MNLKIWTQNINEKSQAKQKHKQIQSQIKSTAKKNQSKVKNENKNSSNKKNYNSYAQIHCMKSMLNGSTENVRLQRKDLDLCYQITTPIDDNRKNSRNLV